MENTKDMKRTTKAQQLYQSISPCEFQLLERKSSNDRRSHHHQESFSSLSLDNGDDDKNIISNNNNKNNKQTTNQSSSNDHQENSSANNLNLLAIDNSILSLSYASSNSHVLQSNGNDQQKQQLQQPQQSQLYFNGKNIALNIQSIDNSSSSVSNNIISNVQFQQPSLSSSPPPPSQRPPPPPHQQQQAAADTFLFQRNSFPNTLTENEATYKRNYFRLNSLCPNDCFFLIRDSEPNSRSESIDDSSNGEQQLKESSDHHNIVFYRPTVSSSSTMMTNDDSNDQNMVSMISHQNFFQTSPERSQTTIGHHSHQQSQPRHHSRPHHHHHHNHVDRRSKPCCSQSFQRCFLKFIIILFFLVLAISIYQSFLLLSFQHEKNNHHTLIPSYHDVLNSKNTGDHQNHMAPSDFVNHNPLDGKHFQEQEKNESFSSFSCESTFYRDSISSLMTISNRDDDANKFTWTDIRLPRFAKPKLYELFMIPDLETLINTGNVSIHLRIELNETSRFLVLHSKKIQIKQISMFKMNEAQNTTKDFQNYQSILVEKYRECSKLEQIYIEFNENLTSAYRYLLVIEFQRQIEDQLEGFYLSTYYNTEKKQKQQLLTTHFEPTLARIAFPCFDEPAMKASFSLKMVHDLQYQVFFNTEKISEKKIEWNGKTKLISTFEPSVPMSTYLVAFVVCDFSVMENSSSPINATLSLLKNRSNKNQIRIRAIVPVGQEKNSLYALNAADKILEYFEIFFKVPYPLKKLDLVAVPDFGAGAMENWGLITFRTTTLLYNEAESSSEVQEQVATVVAHEIAHQWFGNLVTMNWWNDLWLNEGFASYVENLGVDYIHPEWRMLDQFVISTAQHALAMDSLFSSHPIYTTVTNPTEIEAIFDMISYKKGSCLIRMLVDFLGMENLQLGLQKYLNRYKYRTAQTVQLWECFSEASVFLPINVSSIMDTWIFQQGYPLITVKWADSNSSQVIVSQQPFISSLGPEQFEKQRKQQNHSATATNLWQTWIIPLKLITSKTFQTNKSTLYWLNSSSIRISLNGENEWFKFNYQQSGFYRVNYEASMWRTLIQMLSNSKPDEHALSASDRAGLIDDALSLMHIGYLDVNTAMDLTRYLENGEHDYVPWETTLNHFGIIDSIMPENLLMHRYIIRLLSPLIEKLGWNEKPTDGMFEKKLRVLVLQAAIYYGHQETIQKAKAFFKQWMNDDVKLMVNIRDIVYHAGIEYGSDIEWYYCWEKYLNTTVVHEKRLLLGVLGSTRNHYLLSMYLNTSLNRSQVRSQDTYFVIQNVARNPVGREMAWKYIRVNWDQILQMFGQGSFAIDSIISEVTWHFSTEFEHQEVENFFNSVKVGSGKQSVKQSLEKIKANIYWKQQIESKVVDWLKQVEKKKKNKIESQSDTKKNNSLSFRN